MINIGTDLDGVIFAFETGYLNRFKKFPNHDWAITRNVNNILINERDFWLNLPVIRRPNFIPKLYCSARVNKKAWTKKALEINGLPNSPLFQVPGYHLSKAKYIKGRVDVFIEDSLKNFIDLNLNGIPCLLMDAPSNQEWGPIGRIYSLEYNEIEDTYHLFKDTVFDNFKNLL